MKGEAKDPKIFLLHIRDSMQKIESFLKGVSKEKFLKDELRKSAW
jgi:uncharacterized protein with HEPN domain